MSRWPTLPFLQVFDDQTGGNIKTLESEYFRSGAFPIVDQGKDLIGGYTDDRARVCRSDLPVIVFGDHTKTLKYVDFAFCLGADGTKILKPKIAADARYLFRFLQTVELPEAGYSRHFKYLKEIRIPLPPLDEQRRIVAILDQADALRRKRSDAISSLTNLQYRIFEERFGKVISNTKGWPVFPVHHFVQGFQSGKNLVADDQENQSSKYRVLKVSAVTSLSFRPDQSKALPEDYQPPKNHLVQEGDLLFSRANTSDLIGATALVNKPFKNLVLPDKLWRFMWYPDHRANSWFVWFMFRQDDFRKEVSRRATGTSGSMKNISQERLLSIEVGFPPVHLQDEFAEIVIEIQRLLALKEEHARQLDSTFYSLQHRAFRGEL